MPRYHENHLNWQPCFVTDVRGCLIPSFNITESSNPFLNLWFTFQNGPTFPKTFKKCKDIFSYLCQDPNTRIIVRWRLWKITWPVFSFSKLKSFPFFLYFSKYLKIKKFVADATNTRPNFLKEYKHMSLWILTYASIYLCACCIMWVKVGLVRIHHEVASCTKEDCGDDHFMPNLEF